MDIREKSSPALTGGGEKEPFLKYTRAVCSLSQGLRSGQAALPGPNLPNGEHGIPSTATLVHGREGKQRTPAPSSLPCRGREMPSSGRLQQPAPSEGWQPLGRVTVQGRGLPKAETCRRTTVPRLHPHQATTLPKGYLLEFLLPSKLCPSFNKKLHPKRQKNTVWWVEQTSEPEWD